MGEELAAVATDPESLRKFTLALIADLDALEAHIVLTGILPTLRKSDLGLQNMTPRNRYRALNEALRRLRGGQPWRLFIRGEESSPRPRSPPPWS